MTAAMQGGGANTMPVHISVRPDAELCGQPASVTVMRHVSGGLTLSADTHGVGIVLHLSEEFGRRISGVLLAQCDAIAAEGVAGQQVAA